MKCLLYVRVSSEEQHRENQLPQLEEYCRTHGYEVSGVYQENESAFKSGRQHELQRLLDDCRNGKRPDAIIVWALDRLSRQGIGHVYRLLEQFKAYHINFISYQEPWLTLPDGSPNEIMLCCLAWSAQYESKIKTEHTKSGIARRLRDKPIPKRGKDKRQRSRTGYLLRYAK